jgi:pimeloyl-ACP methyl ester carboxylesterase
MINPITFRQKVVLHNDKELWTESFGDPKNPAFILIMGSGGQGIFWPQLFCEQLADKGFFVLRYDHRDTGLSFSVNFDKEPYNLLDMAEDITHIMDGYQIKKASLLGASMGGVIASMLAGFFPERVTNLGLLMTSPDLRASFDAYQGLPARSKLSKPADHILKVAKEMIAPPQTWEEKIALFIKCTYLNNGKAAVDEEWLRDIALQNYVRQKNPDGANNHYRACMVSYDLHEQALPKIKAPTLILHGDSDPIFPIDHAYALQNAIPQSSLIVLEGFGHGLTSAEYFEVIIDNILKHCPAA